MGCGNAPFSVTCVKKDLAVSIVGREVGDKEADIGDVEQGVLRQNKQIRCFRLIRMKSCRVRQRCDAFGVEEDDLIKLQVILPRETKVTLTAA